jgi:hypothetical protein
MRYSPKQYQMVVKADDIDSFKQHFVLESQWSNGQDPTGGSINYHYPFAKDSSGNIIKNENDNTYWQNISNNTNTTELISSYNNGGDSKGIEIGLSKDYIVNQQDEKGNYIVAVGAPRISSRKLFKGGLFIFDVEAAPFGCGVWPALWLNGFIGAPNQYHEKKGTDLYNEGMAKLSKTTVESYRKGCSKAKNYIHSDPFARPPIVKDVYLSEYLGRDVYPQSWPSGGEIDILEQVNFDNNNWSSIHSGLNCKPKVEDEKVKFFYPFLNKDYENARIRTSCQPTYKNWIGCKNVLYNRKSTEDSCPPTSASDGDTQIVNSFGSFGPEFNKYFGGIYATQWVPKEKINIWFWPRGLFSDNYLSQSGGPLSDNPDPDTWGTYDTPDKDLAVGQVRILQAPYDISKNSSSNNDGCDFNFQQIIINITLGGGWAGNPAVFPYYCSVDYIGGGDSFNHYLSKCYKADPSRAENGGQQGVDPTTGCYDGAMRDPNPDNPKDVSAGRGVNTKPVFFSQAKFRFRSIKVFQREDDDNVW